MATDPGVEALSRGQAFVDLSSWRKVAVRGGDAVAWLNDLVSADIGDLEPGRSRRSLLLSPTGGVRAEFTVAELSDETLLLQDPAQSRPIDALLAPYVLSADVRLADRTSELALLAFPGDPGDLGDAIPSGSVVTSPSCAVDGSGGVDVLAPSSERDAAVAGLSRDHALVDIAAFETWRILAGIPRVAADGADGDLPDELDLGGAVAEDKGCYLGQEAVAKARNLGHPRRVLVRVAAKAPLGAGDEVRSGDAAVGTVTSVASVEGRSVALARVRWDAREAALQTVSGVPLEVLDRPGGTAEGFTGFTSRP